MVLRHSSAAIWSGEASLVTGCDAFICSVSAGKQVVVPHKGSTFISCALPPVILDPNTPVVV